MSIQVLAVGGRAAGHPLDPLTPAELTAAVAAIHADGRAGATPRFWGASLDEHLARLTGGRQAELVVMARDGSGAWEVDVELTPVHDEAQPSAAGPTAVAPDAAGPDGPKSGARCLEWRPIDPIRPGITSEEARAAAQACRESPRFQAALAKRGIHDVSRTVIDAESIGGFVPERYRGRRIAWGSVWHRTDDDDNAYARPVQGVVPIIDLHTMEVLEVEDHGLVPMSEEAGPLADGSWGEARPGLRPLDVVQSAGPSFDVDGWKVSWQGWELRLGFTHREGLVLYDVAFMGRSVLRRAACNEMYVPYLDPSPTQYRKNFFDWGEYGAGPLTNSLELGCDCLGVIRYFDGTVLGGDGEPRNIANAICLHEEDASVLWKHTDMRRGVSEVRRSRRLVISNFQTVANYDYGFYWCLYQDGRIELEVKLTGILSASGIHAGEGARHGRVVSERVQTPLHQHYFAVRLDTAVDGPRNRLVEEHSAGEDDPAFDPYGNAVVTLRRPLLRESEAQRRTDPATGRHWLVQSATEVNRYGDPTAYRLSLPDTTRSFCRPDSVMARRAPFIHQHLWATPYAPSERFIGGQYPNNAEPGEDGVHAWSRRDRSLDGEALVLWAVIGTHHVPRPEQWPVMPVDTIGLRLEPDGFFDRNPALDIAAPRLGHGDAERDGGCCCGPSDSDPSGI
jgi:primary-amine oxidase